MQTSIRLIIWLSLTSIFIFLYSSRQKQFPSLNDSLNVALASGGFVTSLNLVYLLTFSPEVKGFLNSKVDFDITAFYLGAIAVAWVSLQPIANIFKANSFVGQVDSCQVNTGKIIYLHLTCKNKRTYKVILNEDLLNGAILNFQGKPNVLTVQNPSDLVGKSISILDISPIPTGRIQELRVTQLEQIKIN